MFGLIKKVFEKVPLDQFNWIKFLNEKKRREELERREKVLKTELATLKEDMALREAAEAKNEEEMNKKLIDLEAKFNKEKDEITASLAQTFADEKQKAAEDYEKQKRAIIESNQTAKNELLAQLKQQKEEFDEMQKRSDKILNAIIEKETYTRFHPAPEPLLKHIHNYPNAFNIQILGCRGSGKSTFTGEILKAFNKKVEKELRFKNSKGKEAEESYPKTLPKTGSVECTTKTLFFDITKGIDKFPTDWLYEELVYDKIFICDQPGIGGIITISNAHAH